VSCYSLSYFVAEEGGAAEGMKYLQQKLKTFLMTSKAVSMEDIEMSKVIVTRTYKAMITART